MSTSSDSGTVRETLCKAVDELATQAMLSEGNPQQIAPLLAALNDVAQRHTVGIATVAVRWFLLAACTAWL